MISTPPPAEQIDDIVLLGDAVDVVEAASPRLSSGGVFAIVTDRPLSRKVKIDIGRVHYNRWVYVGGTSPDIARAYSDLPVRSALKSGGRAWFVGAAGPMGRMHVQNAIQSANGPRLIVCTDVSKHRLDDLYNTFAADARANDIEFVCLNPAEPEAAAQMATYKTQGFDDVIVLVPVPSVIADSAAYLAKDGVMNVFAGVARGTMIETDVSEFALRRTRFIGQSGSLIRDLQITLEQGESGALSRNRTVAAIGSLNALPDGLRAVQDAVFPGKVVIFPHIKDMPLTSLEALKETLPTVYTKLKDGREWTVEAEEEFLSIMLP